MDINLFDVVSTTFGVDKSKKKNTDITDFTQIGLHGLFFFDIILPMNLGFCLDSEGFGALWCSLLPDEFVTLTMSSANHFSPLSFSPVGEMLVTLVLSKTSSVNELQPPLVLPRWGDAGYFELPWTGWCRLLLFCDKPMTFSLPRVSVPPLRGRIGGG